MDTRAMCFVVLLLFSGVITLVKADLTDNSTVLSNNTSTTSTKPDVTSNKSTDKTSTLAVVTGKPTSPTTSAPFKCKIGACNGTGIGDCSTVSSNRCNSGESCAVVQTKFNDTYSSFSFSCAADCHSLVKEGRIVACCGTPNCTPDLSKPIDNNGGVTAVPFNFISFLTLVLMSVLVM